MCRGRANALGLSRATKGQATWTLPGGRVEQEEDMFDAVTREVAEETDVDAVVVRPLGVESRLIPAVERTVPGRPDHQNVGLFHQFRVPGGRLRSEPNGETTESVRTPVPDVVGPRRSSRSTSTSTSASRWRGDLSATCNVDAVPVGGPIQHRDRSRQGRHGGSKP
ncbi:NUDIX hydrolase [Streptomyces sp. NPDC060030]|uniref:NUDIX hydrolase n=1 Tax=Streptomyces sp. NPDC060030 TaxID=3347042 RepID=UPI0036A99D40